MSICRRARRSSRWSRGWRVRASGGGRGRGASLAPALSAGVTIPRGINMLPSAPSTAARDKVRTIAPKLVDLTEKELFGDVWERPGLSKRGGSLLTGATLV